MKTVFALISTAVVAAAALLFVFVRPARPTPAPAQDATITWSVPQLTGNMFPGTSSITMVSFRSSQNLGAVVVEPTPSLGGIVSIIPASLPSISANQDYTLTLMLTAPAAFQTGSFGGTIHVRNSSAPPKTYDTPLVVDLKTAWNVIDPVLSGLLFQVPIPNGWSATRLSPLTAGLYISPASEEEAGGGVSVRMLVGPMTSYLVDPSYNLIKQFSQVINGHACTFVTEQEPGSGLQFYNAFMPISTGTVVVGGNDTPDNEMIINSIVTGIKL
jgi:hypothetical protein